MLIRTSPAGLLLYAAMLCWLGTLAAATFRRLQSHSRVPAVLASFFAACAFGARWHDAGHVPMQNLYEVFLCLGALVGPLSFFWRRYLGVEGQRADALIALAVLFPAGFVFSDAASPLPPVLRSPLFLPHVAAYLLAYVILIRGSLAAWLHVANPSASNPDAVARLLRLGFPLLTLGLLLGAWWGKLAWGDYWNWDPKELWALATWVVYAAFFHVRALEGPRAGRASAGVAILGGVCILLTLLWVNLAGRTFPGLHTYTSASFRTQ